MIRTFLAVMLDDALRDQVVRTQLDLKQRLSRGSITDVRIAWAQPSSIHLTIRFLGDTAEDLIEPLRQGVERAIVGHEVLRIPIQRLGAFPRAQQPRVLWVGPSEQWEQCEEAKRLVELHRAVEAGCRSLGFSPDDNPFSPHVTLARVKEGERHIGRFFAKSGMCDRPLVLGSITVGSIVLVQSELRSTGSVYTKLWDMPIGRHDVNAGMFTVTCGRR